MFINRDWNRTEYDDFTIYIEPRLDKDIAIPKYGNNGGCLEKVIVGWIIKPKFDDLDLDKTKILKESLKKLTIEIILNGD